jgi:outer membrane protein assembly factor BamB
MESDIWKMAFRMAPLPQPEAAVWLATPLRRVGAPGNEFPPEWPAAYGGASGPAQYDWNGMLRIEARPRRLLPCVLLAALATSPLAARQSGHDDADWPQFGYDLASSGASPASTGITAANVASLERHQVRLDGAVDASAIYLHGVTVKGLNHDAFFVTTTYGKTIAVDAASGGTLWEFTPPRFESWAGTAQITNSTPAADPDRQSIYAAAPDGVIRKLAVTDGHVLWATPITLLAEREKIASPLKLFHGRIIAVTGGYIGDQPPYQGHVAILDAANGKLLHVWNSLCSDRTGLIEPRSCRSTRSAIWGRAGAVIDSAGNIFIATGNGPYNGKTDWGDSLIELDPDATRVLANFTPADNADLKSRDLDLGSTSPVLLAAGTLAQGGKDRLIRLVSMGGIAGTEAHMDHELATVPTPSHGMMFTAAAVWHHGNETWLFAADRGATAAWTFSSGKLDERWHNSNGGASPVVAGGLLYVYDPKGGLHVYDPVRGTPVATLECGPGHWNSPIVADGRIALPEGNANRHATSGVLDIWTLPGGAHTSAAR